MRVAPRAVIAASAAVTPAVLPPGALQQRDVQLTAGADLTGLVSDASQMVNAITEAGGSSSGLIGELLSPASSLGDSAPTRWSGRYSCSRTPSPIPAVWPIWRWRAHLSSSRF